MKRYIAVIEIDDSEEIVGDANISYTYRSNGTNYGTDESVGLREEEKTYEDGLNDAWEVVRKLIYEESEYEGAYSIKDINAIFGRLGYLQILKTYTATEAIEKIEKYEKYEKKQKEANEIKVGDEIYSLDKNYKSVVTAIFDTCRGVTAVYFTQNGKLAGDLLENLHKTGRHFPQIAEVLKQMQEGEK